MEPLTVDDDVAVGDGMFASERRCFHMLKELW